MLNARCVEEEWRPGIAKGYVLFRGPKLVRSQLMRIFIRQTYRLCSIKGEGGGVGVQPSASPGIWFRYVQEHCSVLKKPMRACQSFKNLPFLKCFSFFSLAFSDTQFRRVVAKDPVFLLRWRNFADIISIVNTLPTMYIVQYGQTKSIGAPSHSAEPELRTVSSKHVRSRIFRILNFLRLSRQLFLFPQ